MSLQKKRLIKHLIPALLILKAKPQMAPPMVDLPRSRASKGRRHGLRWRIGLKTANKKMDGEGQKEGERPNNSKNKFITKINIISLFYISKISAYIFISL